LMVENQNMILSIESYDDGSDCSLIVLTLRATQQEKRHKAENSYWQVLWRLARHLATMRGCEGKSRGGQKLECSRRVAVHDPNQLG